MISIKIHHIKQNSGWETQYEGTVPAVGKTEVENMVKNSIAIWLRDNGIIANVK